MYKVFHDAEFPQPETNKKKKRAISAVFTLPPGKEATKIPTWEATTHTVEGYMGTPAKSTFICLPPTIYTKRSRHEAARFLKYLA